MAQDPECHLLACFLTAIVSFPLWKATIFSQAGFPLKEKTFIKRYFECLRPPYRAVAGTVLGMTWARTALFYGSDWAKAKLSQQGFHSSICTTAPPLIISMLVQTVNTPIIRASIMLQNPSYDSNKFGNIRKTLMNLYRTKGLFSWWHGLSAGVLKTSPKYVTTVVSKNFMESWLKRQNKWLNNNEADYVLKSAVKSISSGVAGAALTNPFDVIRNEMFVTHLGLVASIKNLIHNVGLFKFCTRGVGNNLISVAFPMTMTIFLTDVLMYSKKQYY